MDVAFLAFLLWRRRPIADPGGSWQAKDFHLLGIGEAETFSDSLIARALEYLKRGRLVRL